MSLVKLDYSFDAFDTGVLLTLCLDDDYQEETQAWQVFSEIHALCKHYEQLFSRTISSSDVSLINKSKGQPVQVAIETARLITSALPYCEKSKGLFDITAGCITSLWDFKQNISPTSQELKKTICHINWRQVQVFSEENKWFTKLCDPRASLDLGGIAKGWIADELGTYLQKAGFSNYLINLGGNVLAHGHNSQNKPWVIRIKNPVAFSEEEILISSDKVSVVTSGTYQRCFEKSGVLYHHILNPRTGYPVKSNIISASIVCEKSLDAEGFSTTALALGINDGLFFCKAQPEIIAAFFIDFEGKIHSYQR